MVVYGMTISSSSNRCSSISTSINISFINRRKELMMDQYKRTVNRKIIVRMDKIQAKTTEPPRVKVDCNYSNSKAPMVEE